MGEKEAYFRIAIHYFGFWLQMNRGLIGATLTIKTGKPHDHENL